MQVDALHCVVDALDVSLLEELAAVLGVAADSAEVVAGCGGSDGDGGGVPLAAGLVVDASLGAVVVGAVTAGADVPGADVATSSEAFGALGIGSPFELLRLLMEAWRDALDSFAGLAGFSSFVEDADSVAAGLFGVATAGAVSVFTVSVVASFIDAGVFDATAVSAAFTRGFAVFAVTSGLGS